jgi:hypothetical protein
MIARWLLLMLLRLMVNLHKSEHVVPHSHCCVERGQVSDLLNAELHGLFGVIELIDIPDSPWILLES